MKTRMIKAALLTYIAFNALTLSANSMELSFPVSSDNGNPVSAPVQGINQAETTNYTILMDDWFASRVSWEQTGEPATTESLSVNTTILEEWVSGLENWEQETGTAITEPTLSGSVTLDQWFTGIETWEQE